MKNGVLDFYKDNSDFTQELYVARRGEVEMAKLAVSNAGIHRGDTYSPELEAALSANLNRLYDSVCRLTVGIDKDDFEYVFELGILEGTGDKVELRVATYQSSLTGNLGNAFEVAAAGIDDPTKTIVYVASLGMGLSKAISADERKFMRKHGTLLDYETNGDVRPLPVVRALARGLDYMGLKVTSVASDSAGALLSMAYGAAYGNNLIESAHQNVRTGVTDKTWLELFKGMMYDDGKVSGELAKATPDALAMSVSQKEKLALVRESMSDRYKAQNVRPKKSIPMLRSYAVGLGRGPNQGDPLLADNKAFAKANPDAKILFTFGERDPLVSGIDLPSRIVDILTQTSQVSSAEVTAAVIENGNHGVQTHFPQYLRRLASTALNQ